MEYRFSLTARLVTLGGVCLAALMVLLFALGVVVGQRVAAPAAVEAPVAGTSR